MIIDPQLKLIVFLSKNKELDNNNNNKSLSDSVVEFSDTID